MYVITQQHDTLDALCFRTLGRTDIISDVIKDNPHALHTPILPAGIRIRLTDTAAPPPATKITLWD